MKDLVSIIVPVYNAQEYLDQCVESIIVQTYKKIELILVNDGSTDNSLLKCLAWAKKDNRVIVKDKFNSGVSSTRNEGLSLAKGEYIMFVDSDDFIDKTLLEVLINNIKNNNSDIAIADFVRFIDDKKTYNKYTNLNFIAAKKEKFVNLYNEYNIITVVQWGKLFKKEIFDGLEFPVGKIHEDEYMIFEELKRAQKVSYILQPLYYYRYRADSIMNKPFNISRYDAVKYLEERNEYFTKLKYSDLIRKNNNMIFNNLLGLQIMRKIKKCEEIEDYLIYDKMIKKYAKKNISLKNSLYINLKSLLYICFPKMMPSIIIFSKRIGGRYE